MIHVKEAGLHFGTPSGGNEMEVQAAVDQEFPAAL